MQNLKKKMLTLKKRKNILKLKFSDFGPDLAPYRVSQTFLPPLPPGPTPLKSLHCLPLSSSSLSCSWTAPAADFDSYEVESRRYDDGSLVSVLKLARGVTAVTLGNLEAFRKYSVTVRVSSAGQTSPPTTHTTVTMIDRESFRLIWTLQRT